jgi:hypothetical protein
MARNVAKAQRGEGKKVYIVLHHEIMGGKENPVRDEMVFWVASSLKQALAMIKRSWVCRWSWWEIQQVRMDSHDWPTHVGFYGRRGGELKRPPSFQKCVKLYLENMARDKAAGLY